VLASFRVTYLDAGSPSGVQTVVIVRHPAPSPRAARSCGHGRPSAQDAIGHIAGLALAGTQSERSAATAPRQRLLVVGNVGPCGLGLPQQYQPMRRSPRPLFELQGTRDTKGLEAADFTDASRFSQVIAALCS